ncbi:MAG: hypothetical protein ACE37J_08025 [Pikeienuella sp.]|uniref:hypothetical protein n=1 Tax=Pikeienuella sp. TaxID=2831957 RepID=UPI00391D3408
MTGTRQPRRLADFGPLSPAERKVLQELDTGYVTVLGDGTLPPQDAGPDRRLRARFVRWCALGAGDGWRVHETGLRVQGALIVSDGEADPELGSEGTAGLNLEGCKAEHDLGFIACRFEDAPVFRSARLAGLFLNGSRLPGLRADRLSTTGGVFLRATQVAGEARLLGGRIGGNLDCNGTTLRNEGGEALNADGLTTTGDVFLRGARVVGEVRLLGAQIGGNLDCEGATLRNEGGEALSADGLTTTGDVFLRGAHVAGEARLVGARIGGDLSCTGATFRNEGGRTLNAGRCVVTGAFFWRKGASAEGGIDLTAAEIDAIDDDPACWPSAGDLVLDRCRYGAFVGGGIDGEARIRWLGLQDPSKYGKDFWPQPWEHCAKVLREMGHPEDARLVLIDKERRQRADRRRRLAIRLEAARTRLRLARASAREVRGVISAFGQELKSLSKESRRDATLLDTSVRRAPAIRDFLHARDLPEGASPLSAHREEAARRLGLAPDHALAAAAPIPGLWLALNVARFWDALTGATIAYGRRPLRAAWWLLGLWLFGAFWFWGANEMGSMKPANALVLRSAEWIGCAEPPQRQTACYLETDQGKSYPEFNALIYAADVLVPVVEIEQQAHWTPDEDKRWGAWFFRPLMYAKIILGWALSLLAVAGFSGLVKSD